MVPRVRPDAGWVDSRSLPKGPNGRTLCRHCGEEVPKGRRTFCGDACVHEWRLQTDPAYVRQQLFRRDRGVCAHCGWDTVLALRTAGGHCLQGPAKQDYRWLGSAYRLVPDILGRTMRLLGIPSHRIDSWWDAHHRTAVVEGGGLCGLDGYETVCIPCHQAETAALAARLATQRRAEAAAAWEVIEMATVEKECAACGGKLVVRHNKKSGQEFLGCERWPDCNYTERVPESIKMRLAGAAVLPGLE